MVLPPCNVLHPCKKNVEERSFSNGNVYDVTCLHTVTGGGLRAARPTGRPDNCLSPFTSLPRTVMRGNQARSQRRANPKRRRTAFDDRAVLIAAPAF